MFRLYFVGGIFGAGKSSLCQILSPILPAEHYKASDLVRHVPDPDDATGKATDEIYSNQERLLSALGVRRATPGTVLLDGHFCLLDHARTVVRVPRDIFERMQPNALVLVETDITQVLDRIRQRDARHLDPVLIWQLAQAEREHALAISKDIGIPIMTVDVSTNLEDIVAFLRASSDS